MMHMDGGFLGEIGFMDLCLGSFNHINVKPVTSELTNRSKITQFGEKIRQAHPPSTVELEKHLTK